METVVKLEPDDSTNLEENDFKCDRVSPFNDSSLVDRVKLELDYKCDIDESETLPQEDFDDSSTMEDTKNFKEEFIDEKESALDRNRYLDSLNKMSSESDNCMTPEIYESSKKATYALLPSKSRKRYDTIYERFMDWRLKHNIKSFSESDLLAYFYELSNKIKPSSLWATYSMLKATINTHQEKINIGDYSKLIAFLKRNSNGFKSNKSKTFTAVEIHNFLQNAPDSKYLLCKVILIIGISGSCRKQEMRDLISKNIEDTGKLLIIKIIDSKTKMERLFVVSEKWYPICKNYIKLRPENDENLPFFLNYQNERCTRQGVGINTFGSVPRKIAQYLGIPDAERYTGHCFRQSSPTILVEAGSELLSLERHEGWRSSSVAEGYVDNSMDNRSSTSTIISNEVENAFGIVNKDVNSSDNKKDPNLTICTPN